MDPQVLDTLNQKLREVSAADDLDELASSFDEFDRRSLLFGMLVGRLYNSFYYQSRRILKRNPTHNEFLEFVRLVQSNRSKLLEMFS